MVGRSHVIHNWNFLRYVVSNRDEIMRTIKFRGKRVDGKGWLHGLLARTVRNENQRYIQSSLYDSDGYRGYQQYEVTPETVGQFTGLTDKNEKEIYEGDIVFIEYIDFDYSEDGTCYIKTVVEYETERMRFNFSNYGKSVINTYKSCLEVIGNIHDNPELLGGSK